jgi:hypothetical protein
MIEATMRDMAAWVSALRGAADDYGRAAAGFQQAARRLPLDGSELVRGTDAARRAGLAEQALVDFQLASRQTRDTTLPGYFISALEDEALWYNQLAHASWQHNNFRTHAPDLVHSAADVVHPGVSMRALSLHVEQMRAAIDGARSGARGWRAPLRDAAAVSDAARASNLRYASTIQQVFTARDARALSRSVASELEFAGIRDAARRREIHADVRAELARTTRGVTTGR